MDKDNCLYIGVITRTQGINGALSVKLEVDLPYEYIDNEVVFVEIDGCLVPFFCHDNEIEIRHNNVAIVHFDDYDNEHQAKELIGCGVYLEMKETDEEESYGISDEFAGYKVIDKQKGEIGQFSEIIEYPSNSVMVVIFDEKEILIPVHESIIQDIDHENRIIKIDAPNGLIDIYL